MQPPVAKRRFASSGNRTAIGLAVALKVAAGLALVAVCLEYGFDAPPLPTDLLLGVQLLAVGLYIASLAHRLIFACDRLTCLREHALDVGLVAGGALAVLALFEFSRFPVVRATAISVVVVQVLLGLRFGVGVVRLNLEMSQRGLHPARLVVLGFLGLIVTGGLLLSLPRAMTPEHRHEEGQYEAKRILNCFFTSASAACVTGLVVYDTGSDFTPFGQAVILGLIQVGGLGIMIFGSIFGVLVGRQLSLRQSLALQDALSHQTVGQLRQMIRFIVLITLLCEAVGAAMLYPMWGEGVTSVAQRVFHSAFHSVSAFCNAGFALRSDSLIHHRGAWQVYGCVMPLIVLGGLGFPVLLDLYRWARSGILAAAPRRRELDPTMPPVQAPGRAPYRFSLHTKIVLSSSVVLIVLPAMLLLLFESAPEWRSRDQLEASRVRAEAEGRPSSMADLPPLERAGAALFQAVTTRTAGFNTVNMDVDSISPASRFLLCLLMFIGGSPASTAGGVKTAALAILILGVVSTLRGRDSVEAFKRTIPLIVIRRAAAVVVVMLAVVGACTLALCYTEAVPLPRVLFEAVSACGTVGLSTGLTDELSIAGRIVVILAMFVGRIGPLTVLIALAGGKTSARYDYPEEQPIIG